MKRVPYLLIGAALVALAGFWAEQAPAAVAATKHNLSVGGPGPIKATSEGQVCVFCHTPHQSYTTGALWNRRTPTNTYTPYSSSTMNTAVGQPNGSSLLCLSCHDGTIALGEVKMPGATATPVALAGGVTTLPAGASNVGLNVSDDHPVSFVYNAALQTADGQLANPATLTGKVRLDTQGRVQCASCHDAHNNANGKFLVMSNTASALCITCHVKTNWAASDHATKTNTYSGVNTSYNGTTYGTPWTHTSGTTVAANACENCHRPHTAPGTKRILNYAKEEDNCLVCHNGSAMNPALKNILGEYTKARGHSTAFMGNLPPGTHDPAEADPVGVKHVECVDCHNPHQARGPASTNAAGTNPSPVAPPLTGARGVTISGATTASVAREEEVCFRCHGDTANIAKSALAPRVVRQIASTPDGNMRQKFQTTNASYHPVAGPGKGTNVPSLLAGWTVTSTMKCTHCHNNNAAPTVGTGGGPNGPHMSAVTTNNEPLLAKVFRSSDPGTNGNYNAANFPLCYNCHSATAIYQDAGPFNQHRTHLDINASCSTCHDPHGVSGGTATNNAHLINFNTAVVTPYNGVLKYTSTGTGRGSCQLMCHGKPHPPYNY